MVECKRKALTVWENPTVNKSHPFALFLPILLLQEISFFCILFEKGKGLRLYCKMKDFVFYLIQALQHMHTYIWTQT